MVRSQHFTESAGYTLTLTFDTHTLARRASARRARAESVHTLSKHKRQREMTRCPFRCDGEWCSVSCSCSSACEAARTTFHFDSCAPTEDKRMAEKVLQRMTSVNVYLSLVVPVNKPLNRAFARCLNTQSVRVNTTLRAAVTELITAN